MGRKKIEKSRIEKGIEKEEKTFALMAKKIVDAIKDEKFLGQNNLLPMTKVEMRLRLQISFLRLGFRRGGVHSPH